MSHHHYDKDNKMVGALNVDNTVSRRHTHSHIHFKPTSVFDHLKTKVKGKKRGTTNGNLNKAPDFVIDDDHISQHSSYDHSELETKKPLIATQSYPNIPTHETSTIHEDNRMFF